MREFAAIGALFGALGVVLGAFGAHALRGVLDEAALRTWHTAVEYQLWHALALLAVSLALPPSRWRRVSAFAFAIGIVLFSGSLYALALGAPRLVGVITPFGGVALIAGWSALAVACFALRRDQ
ncbi:MAG: DUF423 domain-containing protein [Rudaea sp.]|uniref:DUF423 domain-containing protein n=1 Tax=unclassified Rudaea TaxID=2627037 RepID=UPI0010F7A344|nr:MULTISPECIES: DUF423 domain-containing protein [unclassified Rudaea]MBN8887679.1 DUF423 domain-containing protein [Rudaea sp.]MBR0346475.1 DUF423 domain-containing protein [Rudaea sp.]